MNLKYELTGQTICIHGVKMHRIRALQSFRNGEIKKGDFGGFIESEKNLAITGDSWVFESALVYGNAVVKENAAIKGHAVVRGHASVSGNAIVRDHAIVSDYAVVTNNAYVCDNVQILGRGQVCKKANVTGNTRILDSGTVSGQATVSGRARILGGLITGKAVVEGATEIKDNVRICGSAYVKGRTHLGDNMKITSHAKILNDKDVMYIKGIPLFGNKKEITFFRGNGNVVMCVSSDFCGTIDDFFDTIQVHFKRKSQKSKEHEAIIQLVKEHFE